MRAWAALALLLLAPPAQALVIGEPVTLSDYPVQLSLPARGDGFTAWIDVRDGRPQVLLHWDDDRTVRLLEKPATGLQHLVADGRWLAWSQQDVAGLLPGEQAPRVNWDLVVYDVKRQSVVYDSATAQRNETDPSLSGGRVAFLDDVTGVRQVMVADLTGPDAFAAVAVAPGPGRQGPPALDGDRVAFVRATAAGDELVAVDGGAAEVLVAAAPGLGLADPAAWDGRVALPQNRGPESWLAVWEDGSWSQRNWTGGTVMRGVGDGELTVAEVRFQNKQLWAWCGDEEPSRIGGGILSRPAVGGGRVAYLVQVGSEQHIQERRVSCGASLDEAGEDAPLPGLALGLAGALVATALRRRSSGR